MSIEEEKSGGAISFDADLLRKKLGELIMKSVDANTWTWLIDKASLIKDNGHAQQLTLAFAAVSRKTGRQPVILSEADSIEVQRIRPFFRINHWQVDRLCRVWLILHFDAGNPERYVTTIEKLFPTAELSEQVALYSALPVLAHPQRWKHRCSEGIRSNIADVLTSIMCNNPYPSENLDEAAWNQLVLKAIFTDKPIDQIIGLDERANRNLASTLSDYAHERWAAQRTVNPLLWRCVGKFIDEKIFPDIVRLADSDQEPEREAAVLAAMDSNYPPALELVERRPALSEIARTGMTWHDLAKKLEAIS